MGKTTNIDAFNDGNTDFHVAKDPRSRPGLYYGNDGLKRNKDGTYSEKVVHSTKT